MNKRERSWVLYDFANSSFALVIMTVIMPIFFKDVIFKGVEGADSTSYWGYANSIGSFLLAIIAPFLGAFADNKDTKKKVFAGFLFLGVLSTAFLGILTEGSVYLGLSIFIIARISFSGANIFYDSFLIDVVPKARMDKVSSSGFAWGYIGGVIPLVVIALIIYYGKMIGEGGQVTLSAGRTAFFIVAAWWALFSIPILRNVKQKYFVQTVSRPVWNSFLRLINTFKEIRKHKQAFLFLIAYFFYIDGIDTVWIMSTAYGRDIGLGVVHLFLIMLVVNILACPFALLFGRLSELFSTKKMLYAGILIYVLITIVAFLLPSVESLRTRTIIFLGIGLLVATSIGGIQALSRSYFSKLIPPEASAEFFGFYNIFGKFAAIFGPFLMGLFTSIYGHSRYGILCVSFLILAGGLILTRVKELPDK